MYGIAHELETQNEPAELCAPEMMDARMRALEQVRRVDIPDRRRVLDVMKKYCAGEITTLGVANAERVFYDHMYDCRPATFNSWRPDAKRSYNERRDFYRARFGILPKTPYTSLIQSERDKINRYVRFVEAYIEMVLSVDRDFECLHGKEHPTRPSVSFEWDGFETTVVSRLRSMVDVSIGIGHTLRKYEDFVRTRVQNVNARVSNRCSVRASDIHPDLAYLDDDKGGDDMNDDETPRGEVVVAKQATGHGIETFLCRGSRNVLDRQRSATRLRTIQRLVDSHNPLNAICWNCLSRGSVTLNGAENTMSCTVCGRVMDNIAEQISTTDFGYNDDHYVIEGRSTYSTTENFMNHVAHLQGDDLGLLTPEVRDAIRTRVEVVRSCDPQVRFSDDMMRRFLKDTKPFLKDAKPGNFYPQIPTLLRDYCGVVPIYFTHAQVTEMHRMHVMYMHAYKHCPNSVRKERKSSLHNNYLAYQFARMLGCGRNILDRIRMMHNDRVQLYDQVMKWCITYIVDNFDTSRGKAIWAFESTPANLVR